jgi:hypothetical protein
MYRQPQEDLENFLSGVNGFLNQAEADMRNCGVQAMLCPCIASLNQKKFAKREIIFHHLVTRGFTKYYTCWNKHGEEGLNELVAGCLNEGEVEGLIRRTREWGSEWEPIKILLEGDGNSNKMNIASNTRLRLTTQVGQAHVATGVPLDLGTNTQPSDPRTQQNTKPQVFRPTLVRPVSTTGQTGPCW